MDNKKDDIYYINKIIIDMEKVLDKMESISYEDYCNDEDLQDITMFRFIQISENTKKLSKEFMDNHKEVEWGDLIGLRNKIVHEYGKVNLKIVYTSLTEEIPQLYELLTSLDIL